MIMRLTVNLPFKPQSIGYEVPINIGSFFIICNNSSC